MSVIIFYSQGFFRLSIISRKCGLIFSIYPFIDNFLSASIFFLCTFKGISNFLWFIAYWCVIYFWIKSRLTFCLALLTDFFRDSRLCLINQSCHWHHVFFWHWSSFCHIYLFKLIHINRKRFWCASSCWYGECEYIF